MTNPQYLLKYHTDKEFVDFMICCTTTGQVKYKSHEKGKI